MYIHYTYQVIIYSIYGISISRSQSAAGNLEMGKGLLKMYSRQKQQHYKTKSLSRKNSKIAP